MTTRGRLADDLGKDIRALPSDLAQVPAGYTGFVIELLTFARAGWRRALPESLSLEADGNAERSKGLSSLARSQS